MVLNGFDESRWTTVAISTAAAWTKWKVNKKNALLKENSNKLSHVSEAIYKKGLGKKIMIRLRKRQNHRTGWNIVEWIGI